MKPLNNIDLFLKRFNNFKDGEFRSIKIISPTTIEIKLAGQDEAREFDWLGIKLEFTGINDAQLLENKKLMHLDMSNGISILNHNNSLAFGVGECYNVSNIKTASIYLICTQIKYEEENF